MLPEKNLRSLQKKFINAIFDIDQADLAYAFVNDSMMPAAQQINIYRDSVYGGLTKALADTYPVVKKIVGEHFFDAMVARFISSYPSSSYDLNQYGFELADFIEQFTPAESLPYLADVAKLEWCWNQAYNGADAKASNIHELASVTEQQQADIIFELAQDSSLLQSCYPIHLIWQANQEDSDNDISLADNEVKLYIWRNGYDMYINVLQEEEWFFLNSIKQEKYFATVCEQMDKSFKHIAISSVLHTCIQNGWLKNFHIK